MSVPIQTKKKMKPNKLTILISIAIILTLIMVIIVKENQHDKTITEYLDREIQKEEARWETYREFTKNYNELQDSYSELYKKYREHYIYWQNFTVTAYTQNDDGCNNITAIGLDLDKSWTKYFNFCAVDPEVIPYGKTVFIQLDGEIIEALAVDCGYAIQGNRLDFYCNNLNEVYKLMKKIDGEELPVGVIR